MQQNEEGSYKFFTNHTCVLAWINTHPMSTIREIALGVNLTDRTMIKIIGELEKGGYLSRTRKSRRNTYRVNSERTFRTPTNPDAKIGALLKLFNVKTAVRG